ncbi:hypothetical protein T492DRAFT_476498 [Pavlovales sp. CCMP2436]|nr:hypothetical protein T492DRAFT_476498 [Pavlovales sp. CCMP2436]
MAALKNDMSVAKPQRHCLLAGGVSRADLELHFPSIKQAFIPHVVRYGNTNPNIRKADGEHGESIEWKVSCYMEVSTGGGARQKGIEPSLELLGACRPLLEQCDRAFVRYYESLHGPRSVKKLVRMQSFVTRYRPNPQEAGLLRHIDGANVDGSIILALSGADGSGAPTDISFEGGGVSVWERPGASPEEVCFDYPMLPGDVCLLDNSVWHQGNPISAGERWALVIFYQTKEANRKHRMASIIIAMAAQVRAEEAAAAAGAAEAAAAAPARRAGGARVAIVAVVAAAAVAALLRAR